MEKANDFQERLYIYLDSKKLKPSQFERIAGLGNGWCGRANERLSRATKDRIRAAYPELNLEWLVAGVGEMINENAPSVNYTDLSSNNRYSNSAVGVGNTFTATDISAALSPVTAEFGEWRKSIMEIVAKHQESVREIVDAQMKQTKDFLDTIRILAQK